MGGFKPVPRVPATHINPQRPEPCGMSSRWIHERKDDYYYNKAKEEGYRSRASYKLKQIQERFGVFDSAERVVDLGAAPGGWLQVAAEYVGEDGLVVGVDLLPIEPLGLGNVVTIVGDVEDPLVREEVVEVLGGCADVVLSDMAPNVVGDWGLDQFRQISLARLALGLSLRLLHDDGWFVVKVFQGGEHERFIREVKHYFREVKNFKPRASRRQSAERYLVAHGLKPGVERVLVVEEEPQPDEDEGPLPGAQLPGFEPEL